LFSKISESESDESIKPRCSNDESGHLGQSRSDNDSEKQLCDTTHAPSVKHSKTSVRCITGSNITLATSSSSARKQGNQGCHVTPEEAGSFKGGKSIETPNLTSPNSLRNTPPSLTPQRNRAMGRGRGRTRVEETRISTCLQAISSLSDLKLFTLFPYFVLACLFYATLLSSYSAQVT